MTILYIGGERHILTAALLEVAGFEPQLTVLAALDVGPMPSFLSFFSSMDRVVAVAEDGNSVHLLEAKADGILSEVSRAPCPGGPAYVSLDATERWVFTASYGSGESRAYQVSEDRKLQLASVANTGKYSHCAVTGIHGSHVYAASKGTDSIACLSFDGATGGLSLLKEIPTPPGTGPRHLVFSPDGKRAYVSCENDCSLIVYEVVGAELTQLAHERALPDGPAPGDTGSDVHISPDGRFVYLSIRGRNTIASFRVTPDGAELLSHDSTRGAVPRHFCLLGDDRLIVANQEACSLALFDRDSSSGALNFLGTVPTPERPFWVGARRRDEGASLL